MRCAQYAGWRAKLRWLPLAALLALLCAMTTAEVQAADFEGRVVGFRKAGAALRVVVELRGLLTDVLRTALDRGATVYVHVQTELWEQRSLWDRLVRPASDSVSRLTRQPGSRSLVLVDPFGQATVYPDTLQTILTIADLAPAGRVDPGKTYYVHARVVVGTIAEGDISGASDAIFGDDRASGGLGSLGKALFQHVLRLADYLNSESCEITSSPRSGREMTSGK